MSYSPEKCMTSSPTMELTNYLRLGSIVNHFIDCSNGNLLPFLPLGSFYVLINFVHQSNLSAIFPNVRVLLIFSFRPLRPASCAPLLDDGDGLFQSFPSFFVLRHLRSIYSCGCDSNLIRWLASLDYPRGLQSGIRLVHIVVGHSRYVSRPATLESRQLLNDVGNLSSTILAFFLAEKYLPFFSPWHQTVQKWKIKLNKVQKAGPAVEYSERILEGNKRRSNGPSISIRSANQKMPLFLFDLKMGLGRVVACKAIGIANSNQEDVALKQNGGECLQQPLGGGGQRENQGSYSEPGIGQRTLCYFCLWL